MTCMEEIPTACQLEKNKRGYIPSADMNIYSIDGKWVYDNPDLGTTTVTEVEIADGFIINGELKKFSY